MPRSCISMFSSDAGQQAHGTVESDQNDEKNQFQRRHRVPSHQKVSRTYWRIASVNALVNELVIASVNVLEDSWLSRDSDLPRTSVCQGLQFYHQGIGCSSGIRDDVIACPLIPTVLAVAHPQGPYVQCPHSNVPGKKSQRRLSPTATTVNANHHVFQNGRGRHGQPPPHFLVQPPGRTAKKGRVEKETTQPTRRRRCWQWRCQEKAAEVGERCF